MSMSTTVTRRPPRQRPAPLHTADAGWPRFMTEALDPCKDNVGGNDLVLRAATQDREQAGSARPRLPFSWPVWIQRSHKPGQQRRWAARFLGDKRPNVTIYSPLSSVRGAVAPELATTPAPPLRERTLRGADSRHNGGVVVGRAGPEPPLRPVTVCGCTPVLEPQSAFSLETSDIRRHELPADIRRTVSSSDRVKGHTS